MDTMQTMDSVRLEPPSVAVRILLLVLSIGSMIGAVLVLAGVRFGFFYVPLLVTAFLFLRKLNSQEQSRVKKEAPGRIDRPGA